MKKYTDGCIKYLIYSYLSLGELIGSYYILGSKINSFIQYVEREWR